VGSRAQSRAKTKVKLRIFCMEVFSFLIQTDSLWLSF
jgi:hypothetical protein